MPKYYFDANNNEGFCYSLNYFKDLRISSSTDIILEGAKREYGNGFFYCRKWGEVGEVGEGCGCICPKYEPRNGKNGRCRFSENTFIGTKVFYRLTRDNKLKKCSGTHENVI